LNMSRFITEKEFKKLTDSIIKRYCVIERMYKAGKKRVVDQDMIFFRAVCRGSLRNIIIREHERENDTN
jgi:hypothetical protein